VLGVDDHAVRLVLMADHFLADGANKLVILVELKQLWFSGRIALKSEKVFLRVDGDGRHTTGQSFRQSKRIRECEIQIRLELFMNDCVAPFSPGAYGRVRAGFRTPVTTSGSGFSCSQAASRRL